MTVYQNIAKSALMSWNGLSEEEANKKVQSETTQELEDQVYAMGFIGYAIDGLAKELNLNYIEKQQLLKAVVDGPENAEIIKQAADKAKGLTDQQKLNILSVIHDGWVKANSSEKTYNKKKDQKKLRQYMPLELIGWNEVKSDLLFLSPILQAINVQINESELHNSYLNRTAYFMAENNIKFDEDSLVEYIVLNMTSKNITRYGALNDDIAEKLSFDMDVPEQVISNYGEDKDLVNKIAKANSSSKLVENGIESKYFDVKFRPNIQNKNFDISLKCDSLLFDMTTADITRSRREILNLKRDFLEILSECKTKEDIIEFDKFMQEIAKVGGYAYEFYNDNKELINKHNEFEIEQHKAYNEVQRTKPVSLVNENGIESDYFNIKFRPSKNNLALNVECETLLSNMAFADISHEHKDTDAVIESFDKALDLCKTRKEIKDFETFFEMMANVGGIAVMFNQNPFMKKAIDSKLEQTPLYGLVDDKINMTDEERTIEARKSEYEEVNSRQAAETKANEIINKIYNFIDEVRNLGTRNSSRDYTAEDLEMILIRLKSQIGEYLGVIGEPRYDEVMQDIGKALNRIEQYNELGNDIRKVM